MLGLVQLLNKSAHLLGPYFQKEGRTQNTLLLAAYFAANLLQAIVVMFLFSYMSVFLGMFTMPTVTYQLFFSTLIDFTATLFVYGAGQAAKYLATAKLKMSLVDSLNQDLSGRWLNNKKHAYFGIHLEDKVVYPNKVLRDDIKDVVTLSLEVLDISLTTFFGFIIGMYRLCSMSTMLAFQFMGREIAVPGLMALGSVLYAIGYNSISTTISKPLSQMTKLRKEEEGRIQNIIHHIDAQSEAIALQNSILNEQGFYQRALKVLNDTRMDELAVNTWLKFIGKVHQYLSVAVGLIMAAPSIIAKKVQATDVLEINHYFSDIISFFTATNENIKMVTRLNTSVDRINDFKQALEHWEALKQDHAQTHFNQDKFRLNQFSFGTPSGRQLLRPTDLEIPIGKITLLEGATGLGKSTLIKAMAGIWPFSEGSCDMPASRNKVHIIPQKPCLPYESTLFQALTYPLTEDEIKKVSKRAICEMLRELGLGDKIKYLERQRHMVRNWSNELSGGELARIGFISAALKNPKVLILDEALGALNKEKKQETLAFVRKHFNATILVVDHQPDNGFDSPYYDAKLSLANRRLTLTQTPGRLTRS